MPEMVFLLQASSDSQLVALKALTKEWKSDARDSDHAHSEAPPPSKPRAPTRRSIVEGFGNLKKELSILSPLKHAHVISLLGVLLRPLGLVLELAPLGSLKCILSSYADVGLRLPLNVSQAVVFQVRERGRGHHCLLLLCVWQAHLVCTHMCL